jgi:hypothetical protein
MNSAHDRCLQLIDQLHQEINLNDLSSEDYYNLTTKLEDLITEIALMSEDKLIEEIHNEEVYLKSQNNENQNNH